MIAWHEDNYAYEMKAYELIGKQHFYLADLKKC